MTYIYDRVQATVYKDKATIDIYPPVMDLPVEEAQGRTNRQWYNNQIAILYDALRKKSSVHVDLATPDSTIRGYAGGLLQVMKDGEDFCIICPRRSSDAPRSPSVLDISAGMSQYPAEEGDWLDLVFGEGFEEIVKTKEGLYIPQLRDPYAIYNEPIEKNVKEKARLAGIQEKKVNNTIKTPVEIILPTDPVVMRLHSDRTPYVLEFRSGAALEHETGALDTMMFSLYKDLPADVAHFDTECLVDGTHLRRETYVINAKDGHTKVWKGGKITRERDLAEEVKNIPLRKTSGKYVTNKLAELIRHWPYGELGKCDGLLPLLND